MHEWTDSGKSGCCAKHLDLTSRSGGSCEPPVASQQDNVENFRERDVGRVIDREGLAQRPASLQQRQVHRRGDEAGADDPDVERRAAAG